MTLNVNENNLKEGLLSLVIALVEVIKDTLRLQAIRRIDSGRLTDEEVERLGTALADLDKALEDMQREHGIAETVQDIRGNLDTLVDDTLNQFINPKRWAESRQGRSANLVAIKNG